jgi:pimeloyl-ACP methyl ester carboxylesterase
MAVARIYLSPGLFGFNQIGAYAYFQHLERELTRRFADAGLEVRLHLVEGAPTASMRRRAGAFVAEMVRTAQPDDRIHLLGHSTGGLDARLVASKTSTLGDERLRHLRSQLRSVITMNTPHYGTPLASFFATVSGQRLLWVLSALTVTALTFGAPPLALTSSLVAAFGRIDRLFGLELKMLDRITDTIVRALDDASSRDLRAYLAGMRDDQGGIIQLSPESMDLFCMSVEDNPDVEYLSTASYAPSPGVRHWARSLASPWTSPSATIFTTLYQLTARQDRMYPCEPASKDWDRVLIHELGQVPPVGANDGIVPFRSQLWGKLIWAGQGDHLDVVGHFAGTTEDGHVDWMSSGAKFNQQRFGALVDAVARGILAADARGAR